MSVWIRLSSFSFCPNCNAPIRGIYDNPGIAIIGKRPYDIPYYCYECGSPYPWTNKILDNAVAIISMDENIDDNQKELIKNAIPALIIDSPETPVATANYQTIIGNAGQIVRNSLHNLLVDVVSETVKKTLFS